MDAAAEIGRFSLSMEMNNLPRDGTAKPVSRDQNLSHFSCSADHEQDWQSYPVDLSSAVLLREHLTNT